MLPLIPIIGALAQLVPSIAGWLGGDKAEETAKTVAGVATKLVGIEDPQEAVDKILADPAAAQRFVDAMTGLEAVLVRETTAQLTQVNETIRAELLSGSRWQSGWRPFWGYTSAVAFAVQIFGLLILGGYMIWQDPTMAGLLIANLATLMGALTPVWGMALAVLGVAVWKRSDDKARIAGFPPAAGLINALSDRIRGGGNGNE